MLGGNHHEEDGRQNHDRRDHPVEEPSGKGDEAGPRKESEEDQRQSKHGQATSDARFLDKPFGRNRRQNVPPVGAKEPSPKNGQALPPRRKRQDVEPEGLVASEDVVVGKIQKLTVMSPD